MDLTSATPLDLASAGWVPADACTLPSSRQSLRVAEFDALFAATLRGVRWLADSPPRARLVLTGDETLTSLVARAEQVRRATA